MPKTDKKISNPIKPKTVPNPSIKREYKLPKNRKMFRGPRTNTNGVNFIAEVDRKILIDGYTLRDMIK